MKTKIAVITTAYKTPNWVLARAWASLKAQTYGDWSWYVYDDSPTEFDGVHRQVYGYQADERYVVNYMRPYAPSGGNIGLAKRTAFMWADADILVELDHDDELTPDALQLIVDAFTNPEVGFVYSDWCEILPSGESGVYPDGWAFGYGGKYFDRGVWVMRAPQLNATTLGHIVSAPNHVRAWRKNVYHELGGHNPQLEVADDYELVVRTALATQVAYIPKMIYRQHIGPHSAQRQKNQKIQELVEVISTKYRDRIAAVYGTK